MTKIHFIQANGDRQDVEATDGLSVMRNANDHGVPGILGDCGGAMTCATCHVYVPEEWLQRIGPAAEEEMNMLEAAIDPMPNSRLSCKIEVSPELDGMALLVPRNQF